MGEVRVEVGDDFVATVEMCRGPWVRPVRLRRAPMDGEGTRAEDQQLRSSTEGEGAQPKRIRRLSVWWSTFAVFQPDYDAIIDLVGRSGPSLQRSGLPVTCSGQWT